MRIITIYGVAGSGKDTVARYLQGVYRAPWAEVSGSLKVLAKALFSFTDESLWGPSHLRNVPQEVRPNYDALTDFHFAGFRRPHEARQRLIEFVWCNWGFRWAHLSPRHVLQLIGTEWGRAYESGCWARITANALRSSGNEPWGVVSGCRFADEAQDFNVLVDRPGAGLGGPASEHSSEQIPPPEFYDHILPNRGSLFDLYTAIDLGPLGDLLK